MTLTSPASTGIGPNQVRHLEFSVANDGLSAGRFDYDLADPLGWTISSSAAPSGITPSVPAGETYTLAVDVQTPSSCPSQPDAFRWRVSGTGATCAPDSESTDVTCSDALAVGEPAVGFGLGPAMPNPADGSTTLQYRIPERGRVVIEVFTVGGRRVRTLFNATRDSGPGQVRLDSSTLPAGAYLVRLKSAGRSQVQRVVLIH